MSVPHLYSGRLRLPSIIIMKRIISCASMEGIVMYVMGQGGRVPPSREKVTRGHILNQFLSFLSLKKAATKKNSEPAASKNHVWRLKTSKITANA